MICDIWHMIYIYMIWHVICIYIIDNIDDLQCPLVCVCVRNETVSDCFGHGPFSEQGIPAAKAAQSLCFFPSLGKRTTVNNAHCPAQGMRACTITFKTSWSVSSWPQSLVLSNWIHRRNNAIGETKPAIHFVLWIVLSEKGFRKYPKDSLRFCHFGWENCHDHHQAQKYGSPAVLRSGWLWDWSPIGPLVPLLQTMLSFCFYTQKERPKRQRGKHSYQYAKLCKKKHDAARSIIGLMETRLKQCCGPSARWRKRSSQGVEPRWKGRGPSRYFQASVTISKQITNIPGGRHTWWLEITGELAIEIKMK